MLAALAPQLQLVEQSLGAQLAKRPNRRLELLPHVLLLREVGQDPLDRERIWQTLGSFWYGQKGPALAAVDIALWDIAGKAASLPIYKLLGAYRDRVRA